MATTIIEGLEVDLSEPLKSSMCRLGPFNAPLELKETVAMMALEERRSFASMCLILLEEGLTYRIAKEK